MPEEGARPYEIEVIARDSDGTTHTAHGEVHCADPAEEVARGILETVQVHRGQDHVRIIDGDK